MRILRSRSNWIVALILNISSVHAADSIYLVDGEGKSHQLKAGQSSWKAVAFDPTAKKNFSSTASARVVENGTKVEVLQGGYWSDSGFLAPPAGGIYESAEVDSAGNLVVKLGGRFSGFNAKTAAGKVIISNKMEWSGGTAPGVKFREFAGHGTGFYAVGEDHSVWKIVPPTAYTREFNATQIAPSGSANHLLKLGDEVLAVTDNGVSRITEGASGAKLTPVQLPAAADPSKGGRFLAYSSDSDTDAVKVRVEGFRNKVAASAVSADPVASVPKAGKAGAKSAAAAEPAALTEKFPYGKSPREMTLPPSEVLVDAEFAGTTAAPAKPAKPAPVNKADLLATKLESLAGTAPEVRDFVAGVEHIYNDDILKAKAAGKELEIFGRKDEVEQLQNTLVRVKGKNPVLTGDPGVGKTDVAKALAKLTIEGKLPEGQAFGQLKNAIVIETSAGKLSTLAQSNDATAQAAAISKFIKGVKAVEEQLGRPVVVFVDEVHTMSSAQFQALKPIMESTEGVRFVGATTHKEFMEMVKTDDALKSRLHEVKVVEFTPEETFEVLKKTWVPVLEKEYNAKISDDAIRAAIRDFARLRPDGHRPRAPFQVLQDVAISAHRAAGKEVAQVTPQSVQNLIIKTNGSKLNPYDRVAFNKGIEEVRATLRDKVVDQETVTDAMVDLWRDLNQGASGKRHRTMLVAGPTGAGKTFSAQQFAKHVLGDEKKALEIDMTKYMTGGMSLNSLIGTPPGSADPTPGLLAEFLAGKGKGENVIILNELDKAHPDAMKAIMEMLDTGKFQAADGKTYHLGNSLVVFTTNKGDSEIFPPGQAGAMKRADLKARLAKMTDGAIRKLFKKPDPKNLYDNSKELPDAILNRLDRAVPAAPPSFEGAQKVAAQSVQKFNEATLRDHGFEVNFDQKAIDHLVRIRYNPADGVRDLNRAVEAAYNDAISAAERSSAIPHGTKLNVTLQENVDHPQFLVARSDAPKKAAPAEFKAPAPVTLFDNELADPAKRADLTTLEQRLKKHVFGQDDAVKMVVKSIKTRAMDGKERLPSVGLFLGPTGVGKSELAKALALERYGDETAIFNYNMGKIKWEGAMNNLFGSDVGIVGSDKMSPFEKFLVEHPDGGVLNFDEIGNMGGGSTAHGGAASGNSKDSLLKVFYDMIDEGKWVSPHGTVYDLSKFHIQFTSNEMQEFLQGSTQDSVRMANWKRVNRKEVISEHLKKSGWPEALLGRLEGNITVFKPLIGSEREDLARKAFDSKIANLKTQHGLKAIEVDPDFYKKIGDTFFSHTEGGRSLRGVSKNEFSDLVGKALFENYDAEVRKGSTFHLSLEDNQGRQKFLKPGEVPSERDVRMKVRVATPGMPDRVYTTDNLGEKAAEKLLSTKRETYKTAVHEAAHAVLTDPMETGRAVDFINLDMKSGSAMVIHKPVQTGKVPTRSSIVGELASIMAGPLAERALFPTDEFNAGARSDIAQAQQLAKRAIQELGLRSDPFAIPDAATDMHEMQKLISDGRALAEKRIAERGDAIRTVAAELYRKGHMTGEEFQRVVEKSAVSAKSRKLAWKPFKAEQDCSGRFGALPR